MKTNPAIHFLYRVVQGCTFCNTCVYECPVGAITMTREGAVIDPARCIRCGACFDNCASEAIRREPLSSKPVT